MEMDESTSVVCALLAIDDKDYCYKACSRCERVLPDTDDPASSLCRFCHFNKPKRLYRILMSIAIETKVKTVISFDRAAKVLFGCSADEFLDFAKLNPSAAADARQLLEGELFRITLTKPKNGNAQHLRATSIIPLRTGFQPAIVTLREFYKRKAALANPSQGM